MNKRDVIFFVRAYNDADIQMSLAAEFAKDKSYSARVVFFPCDGFLTQETTHELTEYMTQKYGVAFSSFLSDKKTPFILKFLHAIRKWAFTAKSNRQWMQIPVVLQILKATDVGISRILASFLSSSNTSWMEKIITDWNPHIIITDEIAYQRGRSPFIDKVLPILIERGGNAFAMRTGHMVYAKKNPAGSEKKAVYSTIGTRIMFEPSQHNQNIFKDDYSMIPSMSCGNVRMDRAWINELRGLKEYSHFGLPQKPVKVALMLSKMNYGVEADRMKETIRALSSAPEIALAIKPHTRGMKFDFMPIEDIGNSVVADKIPSTALINWADLVLMTGSSIVFHAMVLGKRTGFLAYCQNLETIFDDGKSAMRFNSVDELLSYCQSGMNETEEQKKMLQAFIQSEIHGGREDGLTASGYKKIITDAINSQTSQNL